MMEEWAGTVSCSISLGRKAMTNQNSVLKSIDITLPTKFRMVKVMVFPVVMYCRGPAPADQGIQRGDGVGDYLFIYSSKI